MSTLTPPLHTDTQTSLKLITFCSFWGHYPLTSYYWTPTRDGADTFKREISSCSSLQPSEVNITRKQQVILHAELHSSAVYVTRFVTAFYFFQSIRMTENCFEQRKRDKYKNITPNSISLIPNFTIFSGHKHTACKTVCPVWEHNLKVSTPPMCLLEYSTAKMTDRQACLRLISQTACCHIQ